MFDFDVFHAVDDLVDVFPNFLNFVKKVIHFCVGLHPSNSNVGLSPVIIVTLGLKNITRLKRGFYELAARISDDTLTTTKHDKSMIKRVHPIGAAWKNEAESPSLSLLTSHYRKEYVRSLSQTPWSSKVPLPPGNISGHRICGLNARHFTTKRLLVKGHCSWSVCFKVE